MHVQLGPFRLLRPVGDGGMGVVWEGVHAEGVPIAVKVLTKESARGERARLSFRAEVRAVARLDHPAIVTVLDYGEVDEAAAEASGGQLVVGSPYLAMELATGGSLRSLPPHVGWTELRGILLSLLDGLAHAHAHGVIHRDLKPGNVLVCLDGDLRPGLKLTDFGIAQAMDELQETRGGNMVAGTPSFMAPEQLVGRWRDCGPWTDLYALGCLAWKLATGRTPFHDHKGPGLVRAHLLQEVPPFRPLHAMPIGFETWVRRLLAKEPAARFRRAADAAWQLRSLVAVPDDGVARVLPMQLQVVGTTVSETLRAPTDPDDSTTLEVNATRPMPAATRSTPRQAARSAPAAGAPGTPPMPPTWRSPVVPQQPAQLLGAGLGLFGLRSGRFVGRETERDALWDSFHRVVRDRRPGLVVLRGSAGSGRTRLGRWLCERADEVGAAQVLVGDNLATDTPTEALQRMLLRGLMCVGLWRGQVLERLTELLEAHGPVDEALVETLTTFLCPETDAPALDPGVRYRAILRLLAVLCVERPVVVLLDDVHHGGDCLGFVEHLLRSPDPLPVLVVATAADEGLSDNADAAARLDAAARHERARAVRVDRLAPAAHESLVRELLRLEPSLAVEVAVRTDGNPLFAVEVVGDWVQRGALEVGPDGFRLQRGESLRIPDDVHAVWLARISRALEGLPRRARQDLERAAVLGSEFAEQTWHEACGDDTVSHVVRGSLIDRLQRAELLVEHGDGWRFTHPMVRESLLRQAAEGGRLKEHHRACVIVLLGQRKKGAVVSPEHIGMHLVGAGRPLDGVDFLLKAMLERRSVGYATALSFGQRCERILADAKLPESDRRWVELYLELGDMYRVRGELSRAVQHLDRGIALARAHGHQRLLRHTLFYRAVVGHNAGQHEASQVFLEELKELALADKDATSLGRYYHLTSDHTADPVRRSTFAWEAVKWFRKAGDHAGLANAYAQLAQRTSDAWKLEEARELFEKAIVEHAKVGRTPRAAMATNGLGEVLRHLGDLEQAERCYLEALDVLERVGDLDAYFPLLNLGILALHRGAWLDAWQRFERGRQMIEPLGRAADVAVTHLLMLPCAVSQGEWSTAEGYLAKARELRAGPGRRSGERDAAWALELAGDLAAAARPELARESWAWAAAEWAGCGRADRSDEVERKLGRLPPA